jgi:hypothetical protein
MASEAQSPSSPLPNHEYSLLLQQAKEHDQWPSTYPFEPLGDSLIQFDAVPPPSSWTKHEPGDPEPLVTLLTSETHADLLDSKVDLELQEWHPSQDVMDIILGGDLKVSEFNVRLDDDLYINATKESAVSVFPVHALCPVLSLIFVECKQCSYRRRIAIRRFSHVQVERGYGSF